MGKRAVTIHGHFYQPVREDPNTGLIPREDGAFPYHDWNERVHDQCYRPNADQGNFEWLSFDIGPTLFNWMLSHDPITVSKIITQERKNFQRHGVGNGMAQPYHHTILPLAALHDKKTQILWGIADFEHRFGHRPSGMWLPEAAVDEETLLVAAEAGIEFTILAPWQADSDVVDANVPYWVDLPGGKRIVVFFYDAELSMRVSFDPSATSNADHFLRDVLQPRFQFNGTHPDARELVTIASDGELYGHHQQFRDKFLSYLYHSPQNKDVAEYTYPGLWLKAHPPVKTVKIRSNTSWSCHHGIARWKEACPCGPSGDWKSTLRQAMDQLSARLDDIYLQVLQPYCLDPWQLLYSFIQVLHGKIALKELIQSACSADLDEETLVRIDYLLRAQLNKQRMFTSCGWFFDDFDRIEPRNVVTYAAQAVWWTKMAAGADLISEAQALFAKTKSWRSGLRADTVFAAHIERLRFSQMAFPFMEEESERY
ncbi:MAG TPA: glycoside hydrolase [Anaerolineaceae bacterium]|nr:MAG: hypothetical protein A2X24_08060 [Chloroflexi bacterium GWB2_54_36]HAL17809.1 glycoside hydrolase [Anaerolineaceae bacterium]